MGMGKEPKGFTYKSYNFIDKDPIIDEVRTVFQAARVSKQWVEDHSGVASSTLHAWFDGKTKRPQAATINAVLRSLGKKLGVVDMEAEDKLTTIESVNRQMQGVRHAVARARARA
jgi:hypothetical protein